MKCNDPPVGNYDGSLNHGKFGKCCNTMKKCVNSFPHTYKKVVTCDGDVENAFTCNIDDQVCCPEGTVQELEFLCHIDKLPSII